MTNFQISKYKNLFLLILFVFAFSERVLFDMGPNFELVTTALILSSFYFGRKASFWTVFAIMFLSDLIIGNTNIFIFTWSGFLLPALFVSGFIKLLMKRDSNHNAPITRKIFTGVSLMSTGLSANIFFFLWTNFGVWLLSGMYSKTLLGLLMSYINALPFLRYQLVSTLIFLPLGIVLTEVIITFSKKYTFNLKNVASLNKLNN